MKKDFEADNTTSQGDAQSQTISSKSKVIKDLQRAPFVVRLCCILFSLIAVFYIAIIGKSILVPFVIGFLISMLLLPLANFMERKMHFPRILSSLVSPALFALVVIAVFGMLGFQLADFSVEIPMFRAQLLDLFHNIQTYINHKFGVSEQDQIQFITENAETSIKRGSALLGTALISVTSIVASSAFVFLYTFFFMLYRKHLGQFMIWCFDPQHQVKVRGVLTSIQSIIKQYILALFIQVIAVTTMMFIAYSIIGIKYALLFAVLCGILNLIPYIGIFTATVIASVITLATGEPIQALWVIVAVIIVNSIDGNIITPKIIGSKVSLNSFVVLFGIIVAESMWGIAGMFLAIPILAIFKIIFDAVEDLKPYGFLMGEDNVSSPIFEQYIAKKKAKSDLSNQSVAITYPKTIEPAVEDPQEPKTEATDKDEKASE